MVDLVTYDISCGADDGRCPGAFSVGCDLETTTTTTTTTTEGQTTTTTEGQTTTTAEGQTTTTPSSSSNSNWANLFSITTCVSIFLVQLI